MRLAGSIRGRLFALVLLAALLVPSSGCLLKSLGADLVASTVSAVVGDVVFTILDWTLPAPPE